MEKPDTPRVSAMSPFITLVIGLCLVISTTPSVLEDQTPSWANPTPLTWAMSLLTVIISSGHLFLICRERLLERNKKSL